MKKILKIFWIILVLDFVILIHEFGHLTEFEKNNVSIKEVSIGIGPILYSYQTASYPLNVKAIPIAGYVSPNAKDFELFRNRTEPWKEIAIYFAGVRNNFVVAIFGVFILQIIGLVKKRVNFRDFLREIFLTPLKIAYRFISFCIVCVTFGKVDIGEDRFLVQTGNIQPILLVRAFLRINVFLFVMNLFPLHPLDGGKIADVFSLMIFGSVANVPDVLAVILFLVFFIAVNNINIQIFEFEKNT